MKRQIRPGVWFGTLTLALSVGAIRAEAQDTNALLKQADAAYAEKSYARAIELYRKAKESGPVREVEEVDYRILVSLKETEKWDEAISAADYLVDKAAWKARVYYMRGQIYFHAPDSGYKVKGKIIRGDDFPEVEGAERPQEVYLGEEDQKQTLKDFETAKVKAQEERDLAERARFAAPIYPMPWDQEIDLNFDLAAFLPTRQMGDYQNNLQAGKGGDEDIDLTQRYNGGWPLPKRVLYLYNEIPKLDQGETKHDSALSLLAKGLWVRSYRQQMDNWARKWDEKQNKYIVRPYPFDHLEALTFWQQLVEQYPRDPIADKTQLLIAQHHQQNNDLVKAVAAYRALIEKFPKSRYVSDARGAIQGITRKSIAFSFNDRARPGQKPKISAQSVNVDQVNFAVYRVQLENWLAKPDKLQSENTSFASFTNNFGSVEDARAKFGAPIATWVWKTGDKNDHQTRSETLEVPIAEIGAYIVVASAPQIRYAGLTVISDLALLKKSDRDSTFVYVADARTGAPVNSANVILKELYYDNNGGNKVSVAQGKSDDAGFYEKSVTSGPGISSRTMSAFAWVGNRYALTNQGYYYGYWNRYGDNRKELRVLSYTDRPVYRPEQKVLFRQILTSRAGGTEWKPATGTKVQVLITNPKGEKVFDKELTTGEFGTINGEFTLPEKAPLGEWNVQSRVTETEQNVAAHGASRFRVEEYKRPEFEVSVTAPTEAKRPGETVAARINAKYYFGSPVPNANVKYTVRRSTWWANFRFPTPYDWLYQYWGAGDYDTGRRNIGGEGSGAIVKEGTTKTDSKGYAEITFVTEASAQRNVNDWWSYYSNPLYTIEAEVTDASRRTIEAQGQVKVSDQQYFAFLKVDRDYALQNDRVPVELRTQDANEQPIAASGKMVVYRLLPGDKEEKVYEEAVRTDAEGRLFWNYTAKAAGQFRIAYEATDAWNKEVKASTGLWVAGDDLATTKIRLQGVTILLDKRYYKEEETLRALIVTDQPNATVLFTQETGGEILRRDVFKITGKSREVAIPVDKKHVPNFFLAAAVIQDYEIYQTQQEVFVPPAKQLLNVSVTGDKSEYKPGETGTFTVKATDWRGQPARGEFSLALVDASLFYIQKDYTPDLRQYYYAERRANSVNLDSSRSGNFETRAEDDEKYTNYESHGWELPDDLGQLNQSPGDHYGVYYGYGGGGSVRGLRRRENLAIAGGPPPPAAAMPMMAAESMAVADVAMAPARQKLARDANESGPGAGPAPQIRSNFAETAFWSPAVVTDNGQATVKVTFPDSITQWHATARGLSNTVQVGSAEADVVTRKELIVRLQAPRFFVERDEVTISANVHNYGKQTQRVRVVLAGLDSSTLKLANGQTAERMVDIKAGEEHRVDWQTSVLRDGKVKLTVGAQSSVDADGVEMSFPVLVHGVPRFAAQSGTQPKDGKVTVNLNFPKERRLGASQLNLQLNPSMAAQMLDALPYLVDYPYGCVEQTMSRFLPAAITARTLSESGVNLATLRQRAKAYEAEIKAQPLGERIKNSGYSYPKGMPNSRDLEATANRLWGRRRDQNPVYDQAQLNKLVNDGLQRLYAMQRSDGGWGWWQGSSESDEYMSAYVVYGLAQARSAELNVRSDVLDRGFRYLESQMKDEENLHLLTYIAYSLSYRGKFSAETDKIVAGRLFEQRSRLTAYSKALLAMALWNDGEKEKANVLVRNLENTVKVDQSNGTARWGSARTYWWCWWNNEVEANAVALRAFLQIDPQNRLVPMMMKWLTIKSRGGRWNSTKETAEAVYSLADYVRRNKELDVNYTLKVNLNGKLVRTYRVTKENALFFDNRFIAGDIFLENGQNTVTIEKTGKGNLYWSAYTEYFSLEEPIKASGNEIGINRRFYKLTRKAKAATTPAAEPAVAPVAGRRMGKPLILPRPIPVEPAEFEYERTELKDGATLKSGDLVEIELILTSKNDYTYLVFEDMKAAGLEPVEIRSGGSYGNGLSSNVELRDDKVAFFVDDLPQGRRVLRYRMRAEIPGRFHALPTNGYAMYAPEVRAISDERVLNVKD